MYKSKLNPETINQEIEPSPHPEHQVIHIKSKTKTTNQELSERKRTHVVEEGPKRGFSLRGSKDSLPRNLATQEPSVCLGQLLTYMVTMNTATLATTNMGINQEVH